MLIGSHSYVDGRPAETASRFPISLDSVPAIIYFYYSPRKVSECGWIRTPTSIAPFSCPKSSPRHGLADGDAKSQPGIAEVCAAAAWVHPSYYGVSGCLPFDMDQGG